MGDSDEFYENQNSKHDKTSTCSLYVSRVDNLQCDDTDRGELSKATLVEAIRTLEPTGNWSVYQTPRGLIATFTNECDAEKIMQHGDLNSIFQNSVQIARFSSRHDFNRQALFLRDVPSAIPLEDLSSALNKQGISVSKMERCRQHIRVELLDTSDYEVLLHKGLDFFGAARFIALPERCNWWHNGLEINSGPLQSEIRTGRNREVDGCNYQLDGVLQCYRCQGFWHIAANCRHLPRCVRCGEEHTVDFCPRPRNNPICCHCSGSHHAAYRQCPVRLQLVNSTPVSITLSTNCLQNQCSDNLSKTPPNQTVNK